MASSQWHGVTTGASPGSYNMAYDLGLALRMQEDLTMHPVLRLYHWDPWAISIGHHQAKNAVDLQRCAEAGIDVVRRPTGGRAVLHAEELTYCVVMPAGRRSVVTLYNEISLSLVRGLEVFGVQVSLQKSQPDFRAEYRKTSSIPCFASSARYEIEWGGRKLVGSAQRRFSGGERDVVLQHGSILCGPAHRRLPEFLHVDDPEALVELHQILKEHTVDLSDILGGEVDTTALAAAIRRGFEETWGVEIMLVERSVYEPEPTHA